MSLKKIITFLLTLSVVSALHVSRVHAQDIERLKVKVTSVNAKEKNGEFILEIGAEKSLTYTSYAVEKPWKLVLEFPVVDFNKFAGEKEVNTGVIKSYNITQLGKSDNYIGRMEISFFDKPEYSIDRAGNGITIKMKKADKGEKAGRIATEGKDEIISINNLLFSSENSKFILILETTGKPEFMSYVLKNPLRIVFDIPNSKYNFTKDSFAAKSNFIKGIRVESFPALSRVFLDLATDKIPSFLTKAESDKLIVELSEEDFKDKVKKAVPFDSVDFLPSKDKAVFKLKGVGANEYKVLKLKDSIIVFDVYGVQLNKDIQKTYDTGDVSDIVKSFTVYQVKPVEENRVRFVADLKSGYPYRSSKEGNDINIEFFKEKPVETAAVKPVEKAAEPKKVPAPAPKEPVVVPVVEPKKEVKIKETKPEVVEEVKTVEKKQEVPLAPVKKEEPEKVTKPEEKVVKEEKKEPKPKVVVVTIKPKEEKEAADEKTKAAKPSTIYKGRAITINLKDAEIQHILKLLAEVAKLDGEILNIVTSDDVRGKVSIQLEEVPWDQVLDVIMEVNNLGMKKIGNILRIMPKDKLKKEQEELLAAGKIKEKLDNLVLEIVTVNYAEVADFVDKVKSLLSSRGTVTVDKRNNALIINDLKESIEEAKKLIVKLDTAPQQVVIEARVVEANSDFSKEMGIQWGVKYFQTLNNRYRYGVSGASTSTDLAGTPTFPSGVGGAAALDLAATGASPVPYFVNLPAATGQGAGGGINFALVNLRSGVGLDIQLSAMENKGVGKILSRPRITTLNNIEASIQQGSSIPYETLSDKGTQTQFIDANLMLTVTPRITPDNSIILKVKVSNNNPNTALRSARGVPSIDKNEASTEILVRDGQTIVIGGIIRNKEGMVKSGVPFLMDIPVLGWLFKKESKTIENRELMIFLTPNIIRSITEVEAS